MKKKVLLIAAGRRVSLAQRFIEHDFDVFAYETELHCPIANVATVIHGKSWTDPTLSKHLEKTCDSISPDLILPLADKATPFVSGLPYMGALTASAKTNQICLNKKIFEQTFHQENFYPIVWENYPVILKPIEGANSKGLHKLTYDQYWQSYSDFKDTHIAQRCVDGIEISVDAYFDKQSKMVDAVPRKRLEVQGGEVSRSITLPRNDDFGISKLVSKIGKQIGLMGSVCAQFIVEKEKAYIMEINARLGGGVILSMEAGFDQIQLMKQEWVEKKPISNYQSQWKENFGMTRYFQEYFYQQ